MSFAHQQLESKSESEYRVASLARLSERKQKLDTLIANSLLTAFPWRHNIVARWTNDVKGIELVLSLITNNVPFYFIEAHNPASILNSILDIALHADDKEHGYPIINVLIELGLTKKQVEKAGFVEGLGEVIENIFANHKVKPARPIEKSQAPDFVKPNSPKKQKSVAFGAQQVDEVNVGAPGGPNSPEEFVGGPGGPNSREEFAEVPVGPDLVVSPESSKFNLLAGLVKTPRDPKFKSFQKNIPAPSGSNSGLSENIDNDKRYSSLRPGGRVHD